MYILNISQKTLPPLFMERLHTIIPSRLWDNVQKTFQQERPATFRVNTLKTSFADVRKKLESKGFKTGNVIWYKDAFILLKGRQRDLEETDLYQGGEIHLQGLSSMIPPLVLSPKPGEKILDLAAAPGSKTTQIACLMGNKGQITAGDENPVRLEKLKANVEKQGATIVTLLPPGDGGLVWKKNAEAFDRVLLDAPCSSEGRFFIQEPSTYKFWKENTNRKMAKLQRRLFKSAFLSLKPGGLLVYSTCTFAPEENEMILDWALQTFGALLQIENILAPLPLHTRGLSHWKGVHFHASVTKSARILPTSDIEGFFVAKIRKTKSVSAPPTA
jgi:NOL1/NOP2/sun family putative RNA methylase